MSKVKLISKSVPEANIEGIDSTTDNVRDLIAYCARVSNPANQKLNENTDRLIKYLLEHKHFSPFEMASACIEIRTTRDIARQILRHRSFSFQEFSQRYANPDELGEQFVLREARMQDEKNRQNSIECSDVELDRRWRLMQEALIISAKHAYAWATKNGIAKEQARCVLPEGNTVSVILMSGTIRSWLHYIDVRTNDDTQKEHRDIAMAVAEVIGSIYKPEEEE